jgi:HK97 family phage major capsid protein
MGTSVNQIPVPRGFPKAGWVKTGGRKPFTDLKLGVEQITAEEIAAVVAIPDVFYDDFSINLWNYARPLVAEAIAIGLDAAVFFGEDAPDTFPAGGIAAVAADATAGADPLATVNNAMSALEVQGVNPTGFAADVAVRGALRGVRGADGAFLMGDMQWRDSSINSLYGLPIAYVPFGQTDPDFFVGGWRYAILGVRQDIRFETSRDATIVDENGAVIVSGFQDNVTIMKCWARFAFGIVMPGTPRNPDGANPFVKATVVGAATGGGNGGSGGAGGASAPIEHTTGRGTQTAANRPGRRA